MFRPCQRRLFCVGPKRADQTRRRVAQGRILRTRFRRQIGQELREVGTSSRHVLGFSPAQAFAVIVGGTTLYASRQPPAETLRIKRRDDLRKTEQHCLGDIGDIGRGHPLAAQPSVNPAAVSRAQFLPGLRLAGLDPSHQTSARRTQLADFATHRWPMSKRSIPEAPACRRRGVTERLLGSRLYNARRSSKQESRAWIREP